MTAGLPQGLELTGGFIIRVTATDGTSGATVSGVNVSNVVITASDLTTQGEDLPTFAPSDILLPVAPGQTVGGS